MNEEDVKQLVKVTDVAMEKLIPIYDDINYLIKEEKWDSIYEYVKILQMNIRHIKKNYSNIKMNIETDKFIKNMMIDRYITKDTICDELNSIIAKYGDDSLDMIKCYLHHLENGTIENVK